MPATMQALSAERYMSLATFRRNGAAVETPVWFAETEGKLYVFSASDSGKVKRLRHSPRARVAACNARGRIDGAWIDARARIVAGPAVIDAAYAALRAKYGWQMQLTDLLSRLTGRYAGRAILEIELESPR
jgi:PPOX class probable F420-dependent enzyme